VRPPAGNASRRGDGKGRRNTSHLDSGFVIAPAFSFPRPASRPASA